MTTESERCEDVQALVRRYAAAAAAHWKAIMAANSRRANKEADILDRAYKGLRARGQDAQRELLPLLESDDPSVRCWAASHALEFAPQEAEAVLAQLAARDDLIGYSAENALKGWRKGTWRFP